MPPTVDRFSFARMSQVGSAFGFPLDFATIAASSTATGRAAANVQSFLDAGAGEWWQSTNDDDESLLWDRGSGTLEALTWFHAAGAASAGSLKGASLTVKTGSTTGVLDHEYTLTHSDLTDDWFATFAGDASRYWKLFMAGGAAGYFRLARATGGSWTTVARNFLRDYQHVPVNNTVVLKNVGNSKVHRYYTPQSRYDLKFAFVGGDDLAAFEQLRAYAGAGRGPYAPEVPMWVCPDPSLALAGGRLPPMFATLVSDVPYTGTDAAGQYVGTALSLLQVGK